MNVEHFSEKYTPEPNTGCWLWTDNVKRDGYGQVRFKGKNTQAHRVSWLLYRGEIPHGMFVCHRCDVKTCVNPDHLFIGSAYDNIMDAFRKGRVKTPTARALGEKHGSAKLTNDEVRAILADTRSQRVIAADYGVSQMNVYCIKKGRTWKQALQS